MSASLSSRQPVFIGGLSHSGKTALRRMLDGHPNLALTRRTYFWPRFYGRYGDLRQRKNFDACFAAMLRRPAIRRLTTDPERLRREFWQGERLRDSYARLFALFHEHYAEQLGRPRWGDQTAFVERYADAIFAAYPDARLVQMMRDPRDRYAEASAASRGRPGKAGWEAAAWHVSATLARRNQALYPGRYLVLHYEALVADPEETLRQVCDFLGEPFWADMLAVERMAPGDEPAESPAPAQLSQDTRAGRRALALTQSLLTRQMRVMGYEPAPVVLSSAQRLVTYLLDWPASALSYAAGRLYHSRQWKRGRAGSATPTRPVPAARSFAVKE